MHQSIHNFGDFSSFNANLASYSPIYKCKIMSKLIFPFDCSGLELLQRFCQILTNILNESQARCDIAENCYSQCMEVLKPWKLKTDSNNKQGDVVCTCAFNEQRNEQVENVITGIDKFVQKARRLRLKDVHSKSIRSSRSCGNIQIQSNSSTTSGINKNVGIITASELKSLISLVDPNSKNQTNFATHSPQKELKETIQTHFSSCPLYEPNIKQMQITYKKAVDVHNIAPVILKAAELSHKFLTECKPMCTTSQKFVDNLEKTNAASWVGPSLIDSVVPDFRNGCIKYSSKDDLHLQLEAAFKAENEMMWNSIFSNISKYLIPYFKNVVDEEYLISLYKTIVMMCSFYSQTVPVIPVIRK